MRRSNPAGAWMLNIRTGRSLIVAEAVFACPAARARTCRAEPAPPGPSEQERHLALDDVERVVLFLVDVGLELASGSDLDDPEREARRIRGASEELHVAPRGGPRRAARRSAGAPPVPFHHATRADAYATRTAVSASSRLAPVRDAASAYERAAPSRPTAGRPRAADPRSLSRGGRASRRRRRTRARDRRARDGPAGDAEVVRELTDRGQAGARRERVREHERGDLLAQLLVRRDRRARVDLEHHAGVALAARADRRTRQAPLLIPEYASSDATRHTAAGTTIVACSAETSDACRASAMPAT